MEKAKIKSETEEGQIGLFSNETPKEAKKRARRELAERLARTASRQPSKPESKPHVDIKKAQAGERERHSEEE